MGILDFYKITGSDFETTLANLRSEERILKFVKLFSQDPSFEQCRKGLEEKNAEDAFLGAHTLKGICLNMGFTRLQKSSSELTENLRDRTFKDNTQELFEAVRKDYEEIIENLKQLA